MELVGGTFFFLSPTLTGFQSNVIFPPLLDMFPWKIRNPGNNGDNYLKLSHNIKIRRLKHTHTTGLYQFL